MVLSIILRNAYLWSGGPLDTHGSSMARRAGLSSLDLFLG